MPTRGGEDRPAAIGLTLEEALALFGLLEDLKEASAASDRLSDAAAIEIQLDVLARRLGFRGQEGGDHDGS